ncbi:hypothetical protein LUZ61_016494 [Rhynchospora tenuis]|uniref:Wall-associated receptor kinase galacturonan-binding domain-containing protein n=1 Tax=Rhynchospora tenuis TaxID=198213 RepID=A0AAD6EK23_9POAL|nr:hypothetical protein LUZ61_016494 [Rhynchospora tenuis]
MSCVRQLKSLVSLTLIISLLPTGLAASTTQKISLPGCPDKCGNITIPYPFGTRPGCYRDDGFDGFQITCDESITTPKAFVGSNSSNIEMIDINITSGETRVYKHIGYRYYDTEDHVIDTNNMVMDTMDSPYLFSYRRNKFTVIGCHTLAYIAGEGDRPYQSGCASFCEFQNSTTGSSFFLTQTAASSCNGLGCCQTAIPAGLNYYKVKCGYDNKSYWWFNPCNYAVLVEEDSFKFQVQDLMEQYFLNRTQTHVPFVLDWAIRTKGTCQDGVENSTNRACLSYHSFCRNTSNGEGYLCQCSQGYQGNPYLFGGCCWSYVLEVNI